jgi:ketosteroid isomerase-like protein
MTVDDVYLVTQAEQQLAAAHLAQDFDTIDFLLHPDYVIIQPGGQLETKSEFLDSFREGQRHWEKAQVDQLDIRLQGDAAIVIGRWQASGHHGSERFDYAARFLSIWVKEDGRWQNFAYQATEMKENYAV